MRGQRHVVELGERMIRLERLGVKDVEPGMAEMPALQRRQQRSFVDERPARGVDEDRAGLHARHALGAEKAPCLLAEREMQRDHVRSLQQGIDVGQCDRSVGKRRAVKRDHLHAQAFGDARHLAPDAAEPDNAQRLAPQLHAFERRPGPAAHRAVHARNVAGAGEHQRDGVLGDRDIAVALDGMDA